MRITRARKASSAAGGQGGGAAVHAGASRWVAEENWHPEQQGKRLGDGSYELRIPYNNPRELVMDILRCGPDVLVIEPASLVEEVRRQLRGALERYGRE